MGILTFNRPKALNALDPKTLDEVSDVLDKVAAGDEVRVLVLTGAGDKAFVAGADITEFPQDESVAGTGFRREGA